MMDPTAALIDRLTYINYAANRDSFPHLTPQSWKRIYGEAVDGMEARYQQEKQDSANRYADEMVKRDLLESRAEIDSQEYDTFGMPLRSGR
jgi:hypothetical protein